MRGIRAKVHCTFWPLWMVRRGVLSRTCFNCASHLVGLSRFATPFHYAVSGSLLYGSWSGMYLSRQRSWCGRWVKWLFKLSRVGRNTKSTQWWGDQQHKRREQSGDLVESCGGGKRGWQLIDPSDSCTIRCAKRKAGWKMISHQNYPVHRSDSLRSPVVT